MGKIYCTECGTELDESVKFCSSCGSEIGNNNSNNDKTISDKNVEATTDLMKRIELPILIGGIVVSLIMFNFMGKMLSWYTSSWYGVIGWWGVVICAFLVGYLSRESIKFVLGYAIVMDVVLFLFYSNSWEHNEFLLSTCILVIIFAFIGKFVKIKIKG